MTRINVRKSKKEEQTKQKAKTNETKMRSAGATLVVFFYLYWIVNEMKSRWVYCASIRHSGALSELMSDVSECDKS